MSPSETRVVVVGAGLAGLACTLQLSEADVPVRLLEAADGVGGRVRTDVVEGFRLDRGFQVLLTAYPETRRVLDYAALDLKPLPPRGARPPRGSLPRAERPLASCPGGLTRPQVPVGALARDHDAGRSVRPEPGEGGQHGLRRPPPSKDGAESDGSFREVI